MKFIVTTTQSAVEREPLMELFLQDCGFPYVPRQRKGLELLMQEHHADGVIVWERQGPVLYIEGEKFFFHPSMAKNRIAFYRKMQRPDLLVKACQLQTGDSFLDCTLGMGADSIVASYFSESGRICGLEHQTAVACVISWGMKLYSCRMPWLNEAIQRIEVINRDHQAFLQEQDDHSFDIVYFDPMFQKPLMKSQPISPLRKLADHDRLQSDSIREACRVARKRVVMKDLSAGEELERLGFTMLPGSRHNKLAYGMIEV